jgi:hydroxymethylpyrimidine pyrophosphatase-like HAD family hydrolase
VSYRFLLCDLDGTLLDHPPELDAALVAGLRRARERGLIFSIATGRMPPGADRFRDELGITAPMIFYNGALVRDHEAGRDLMALTLPRGILWQAHDAIAHAPVDPLFYVTTSCTVLPRAPPHGRTRNSRRYRLKSSARPVIFSGWAAS